MSIEAAINPMANGAKSQMLDVSAGGAIQQAKADECRCGAYRVQDAQAPRWEDARERPWMQPIPPGKAEGFSFGNGSKQPVHKPPKGGHQCSRYHWFQAPILSSRPWAAPTAIPPFAGQAHVPLLVPSGHLYPSIKSLLPRMPGGSSLGVSPGDCLLLV